jgi:metal-responsive CopG/Arc/MetJ family transcriptional regulator
MAEQSDPVVRKTVSLPESLWRRIEDFQFKHRVKRDAEAVRRLIELGLEADESRPAPKRPR